MLGRRPHPVILQHHFRRRHLGSGPHAARPRHRRGVRPAENRRRTQAAGIRGRAAMTLIGKLLGVLVKQGALTVVDADGKRATYGPGGEPALTVRFTDRKVPLDLLRNPRLGIGETYMDGQLAVEDGAMLDLLRLVVGSNRWEDGGRGRKLFG